MSNDDLIKQLEEIKTLAMWDYPFPKDPLDPNLLVALGFIAGTAQNAIETYLKTIIKEAAKEAGWKNPLRKS